MFHMDNRDYLGDARGRVVGHRAILVQRAREHADDIRRYDDESRDLVDTLVQMANLLVEDAEIQERFRSNPLLSSVDPSDTVTFDTSKLEPATDVDGRPIHTREGGSV